MIESQDEQLDLEPNPITRGDPRIHWLNEQPDLERDRVVASRLMPGDQVSPIKTIAQMANNADFQGLKQGGLYRITKAYVRSQDIEIELEGVAGRFNEMHFIDPRPLRHCYGVFAKGPEGNVWFQELDVGKDQTMPVGAPFPVHTELERHLKWNIGTESTDALVENAGEFIFRKFGDDWLVYSCPWWTEASTAEMQIAIDEIEKVAAPAAGMRP